MVRSDLSQAADILTQGFYPNVNPNRFFIEKLRTSTSLESTYPQPTTEHELFVACLNEKSRTPGKVIAVVEIDNRPTNRPNAFRPYMCNLAVAKDWQRQGIAQDMICLCEETVATWATKADGESSLRVHLKVKEVNDPARKLYERMGYRVESNDERDAKTGDVLLLMTKDIDGTVDSPTIGELLDNNDDDDVEKRQQAR